MSYYYLNPDKTYRQCDVFDWINQFEHMDMHVGSDMINGFHVSTVCLGINHAWFGGPPLLFETMIFDNKDDRSNIYQYRYSTWDEAVEGHKHAIQWVLDGCIEE